ncbi:hypothetical protein DFH09DRAFT_1460614 [Mycena vulgaris]|nr:hypothetical protein DFH09DRAFT_1460614 [Mycena vulgaris]
MNPAILNLSLDPHARDTQYLTPQTNISGTSHATESVETYGIRYVSLVCVFHFVPAVSSLGAPVFIVLLAGSPYSLVLGSANAAHAHPRLVLSDDSGTTRQGLGIGVDVIRPRRARNRRLYGTYLRPLGVALPGSLRALRQHDADAAKQRSGIRARAFAGAQGNAEAREHARLGSTSTLANRYTALPNPTRSLRGPRLVLPLLPDRAHRAEDTLPFPLIPLAPLPSLSSSLKLFKVTPPPFVSPMRSDVSQVRAFSISVSRLVRRSASAPVMPQPRPTNNAPPVASLPTTPAVATNAARRDTVDIPGRAQHTDSAIRCFLSGPTAQSYIHMRDIIPIATIVHSCLFDGFRGVRR